MALAQFFSPKITLVCPLKPITAQKLQTHMAKSLSSGAAVTGPPNFTVESVTFLFSIQDVWDSNIDQDLLN
jgi:hypothetical protein